MTSNNTTNCTFETKGVRKAGIQETDEAIVQDALNETGFGKFNYKILAICCLISMNCSFTTMSMGFILPSATCDLKMTTADKGQLTASFTLGMFLSSFISGCLADTNGRKLVLIYVLYLNSASEFLASLVSFYWGFLILKFISGVAICGQLTVFFTYLAEFQPNMCRSLFLSWLDSAWIFGIILVTCVAWVTIPLNISYNSGIFSFHSWNFFVMMCSLPPLMIGTWLTFFPETPKYLADIGQNAMMLDVLGRMYSENTGNTSEEYFVSLKNGSNQRLSQLVFRFVEKKEKQEESRIKSFKDNMINVYSQTLMILRQPFLRKTLILCLASYLVMSSYYMFVLWFPQIFQKYAEFESHHPNKSANVCNVIRIKSNKTITNTNPFDCGIPMENSVYLYTLILALVSFPVSLILPLLITRVGYAFFLVSTTILTSIVTLCIFLVKTSTDNLIVSCFFESLTSIGVCVVICMAVELYPTRLRSIAVGLATCLGRFGSIMGNLITGLLIDTHCTTFVIIVALQLLLCGVLTMFTTKEERKSDKEEE